MMSVTFSNHERPLSKQNQTTPSLLKDVYQRWWPHFAGLYLVFHISGLCLQAFPSVASGLNKNAWKNPTAQAEFHQWAGLARSVGVDVSDRTFEEFLWKSAKSLTFVQKRVLMPWNAYLRFTGAQQSWRMFVAPHRYPSWLVIEIETSTLENKVKWEEVYRSRSSEKFFLRTEFDNHRMRKYIFLTSWKHRRAAYRDLVRFISRRAAVAYPDSKRVRVRQFIRRTRTPVEVQSGFMPKGKYQNSIIMGLEKFRNKVMP